MDENGQQRLLVSSSPHVLDRESIPRIMWSVNLALLPAAAMGVYFFGWPALRTIVLSVAAALLTELACLRGRGQTLKYVADGSAVVTGLLLAMVIPASAAYYCPIVGSVFAVAIGKHTFGGLGCNIWNPALAGRIFLQFAYPSQMSLSRWPVPRILFDSAPDAATMPSPLFTEAGGAAAQPSYLDLFLGNGVTGSLGETCKLALLIGGVFLLVRSYIDWRVPVVYIATVFVLSAILPASGGGELSWANDPFYHVLSGGLVLGAFFMATDMVTTPITPWGRAVFAAGCGLLTALIRFYGGYPEGVAYSIFIMNTTTPLIDRWVRPRVYGSRTARPARATP